jgi:hypothetical protein
MPCNQQQYALRSVAYNPYPPKLSAAAAYASKNANHFAITTSCQPDNYAKDNKNFRGAMLLNISEISPIFMVVFINIFERRVEKSAKAHVKTLLYICSKKKARRCSRGIV